MKFTYQAYNGLLDLIEESGYSFADYHNWQSSGRCVILRHDIDNSLSDAVRLGELEAGRGIHSTFFVLLRSDFYNPASAASVRRIRSLYDLGHEIGLHYDEAAYDGEVSADCTRGGIIQNIVREARILGDICAFPIRVVSMHRPSRDTLEADYQIPGIINSYGKTFFQDFKYLSDSRRRWREPVEEIVREGKYDRLHILTHAFWYHEEDMDISEAVRRFVRSANRERYGQMGDNITDLASIMRDSEV